jgi:heme/copper-type cytochrome/quinol oxidase subunit 2
MSDVRTYSDPAGPVPTPGGPLSYIHWGPAFAGALVAAAVSFVLMSFASAIGLMVVSPSPTWRDTSVWLAILSGVWIIVVAAGAFGLGGYLAGRVRSTWKTTEDEVDFRDGVHGLLVWAIGVVVGVALLWASATTLSAISGASSSSRDAAGSSVLAYELDRLFRSERRLEPVAADVRAEATRLLMKGIGRTEMPTDDRTHLNRIVAGSTGLQQGEAERRVVQVLAEARSATTQTRRSAVILGFAMAAGLAAAAAAAWFAAGAGGRHRDSEFSPPMRMGRVVVRTVP